MRIDLEKIHHFSSIGTFVFTVCILVATVWPLLPHRETPATAPISRDQQQGQIAPTKAVPAERPMTVWIMPSLLGLVILIAAAINLKAASEESGRR